MVKLYNDGVCYGELGEYTGFKDWCVGDILRAKDKENDEIANVVIVYDFKKDRFSALGLLYWEVSEFENDYAIEKVMSWKDITEDNINWLTWTDGYSLKH